MAIKPHTDLAPSTATTSSLTTLPKDSMRRSRKSNNSTSKASSASSSLEQSPTSSRQSLSSLILQQPLENLLEMIRPQRQALLKGPRITIRIGDTSVAGVLKRAAMAVSSVLNKHFTGNPESTEYRFSRGEIHSGAVRLLLIGWMRETCNEFETYAILIQNTFEEDVAVLRAVRLLGMERYCSHILTRYVNYLKTELPTYEQIVAVEQNATSHKDPLWTAMVNHLCHDRFKGLIPDVDVFEAFLEKHGRLRKAMEAADAFFAGYARERAEERDSERRERRERNQAQKRERIMRERQAAQSLKKKLVEKGLGLMSVTADEADVLRTRTR